MTTLDIYRAGSPFVTIKPDSSSAQTKKVMGDNIVSITFEDSRYIKFAINDYCIVFGELYRLNKLPAYTKVSRFLHKYSLTLQAEAYDLVKVQYLFLGPDNALTEADFSLMGTPNDFMNLLIQNANRVGSGWVKGQVVDAGYKNLTFSKDNCYNALSRLAEEFSTEFSIEGKTIHLTKRTTDRGYTYKHGRNNGLYEINRINLNDSDIVTRLYVFGSDKNIPSSYNGTRLRLPGYYPYTVSGITNALYSVVGSVLFLEFHYTPSVSTGATGVRIEYRQFGTNNAWGYQDKDNSGVASMNVLNEDNEYRFRTLGGVGNGQVTSAIHVTGVITDPLLPGGYSPYLEKNVDLYGVIELTEIFDDIYPTRTGKVTSVNVSDPFIFFDTAIDFNINDQLLPGLAAKVVFNTGQLAGYQFEINRFDNGTKEIRILKNKDEVSLDMPSSLLRPAIGDEFVLVDIILPQPYIEAAEIRLRDRAIALLDQYSQPQLSYSMLFDPTYLRKMNQTLSVGDLVWIVDLDLELQRKIRIVSTVRNLNQEFQYQVEMSDTVSAGTISLLISSQLATDRSVQSITNQVQNNSILNNNVIGPLIFQDLPETSTTVGFSPLYMEDSTGKLFRKV